MSFRFVGKRAFPLRLFATPTTNRAGYLEWSRCPEAVPDLRDGELGCASNDRLCEGVIWVRRYHMLGALVASSVAASVTGCTVNIQVPTRSDASQPTMASTPTAVSSVTPSRPASTASHAPPSQASTTTVTPVPTSIDTSIYTLEEYSEFTSPSGRISCVITRNRAWCTFPDGMDRSNIPHAAEVCAPDSGPVGSVEVSPTGVSFNCGDVGAIGAPPNRPETRWADSHDFDLVNGMVTLPYGWTLATPRVFCTSAENGVACLHVTTEDGFRVARAGVTKVRA